MTDQEAVIRAADKFRPRNSEGVGVLRGNDGYCAGSYEWGVFGNLHRELGFYCVWYLGVA